MRASSSRLATTQLLTPGSTGSFVQQNRAHRAEDKAAELRKSFCKDLDVIACHCNAIDRYINACYKASDVRSRSMIEAIAGSQVAVDAAMSLASNLRAGDFKRSVAWSSSSGSSMCFSIARSL